MISGVPGKAFPCELVIYEIILKVSEFYIKVWNVDRYRWDNVYEA